MYTIFRCSVRGMGVQPLPLPPPASPTVAVTSIAIPVLFTGLFSPVNELSSTDNSIPSITRTSAGTRSPVVSITRSPRTSSRAGNLSCARPSRTTVQVCGTRSASFSSAGCKHMIKYMNRVFTIIEKKKCVNINNIIHLTYLFHFDIPEWQQLH